MKILLMADAYPPSTGGIELFSSLMREGFQMLGHEVRVVTAVEAEMPEDGAHRIERNPDKTALKQAIAWADICFVSGFSLHYQVPALLGGKPLVITHHDWQQGIDGKIGNRYRIKCFVCRYALNIAVSHAVAVDLPLPALTIHNPLHVEVELGPEFSLRPRDLVFVGPLVSETGVNVLLDALAQLRDHGRIVNATIVGDGPERSRLERQANLYGFRGSVVFRGQLERDRIHFLLMDHGIMALPSLDKERYGTVALEGLAAGCVVLASDTGALTEAIGPCGQTFPPGDSAALAALIENLVAHPEWAELFRLGIPAHLEAMRLDRVAARYLEAFERLHHYQAVKRMSRRKAIRLTLDELAPHS